MKDGGMFIATTIDCAAMVELFSQLLYGEVDLSQTLTSNSSGFLTSKGVRVFVSDKDLQSNVDRLPKKDSESAVLEDVFASIRQFRRPDVFNHDDTEDAKDRVCGAIISNEAGDMLLRVTLKV